MRPILEVTDLWKKYQIGANQAPYLSLREKLTQTLRSTPKENFWALKGVNFSVEEGESLGIIGRNGAGKSTLLKILSRITPPTKGYVRARGRVASLLEVGTGFHPELTGRENVYLNGSILGLKRREIASKFDAIVDFSGVEQFLDTALKHYSSGMRLRLAFSVAAHLEPEILMIDEVLAVGDAEFQKKCLGKMDEVSRSGRTVLFVSHHLGAVRQLCKRSILLEEGKITLMDSTNSVINHYLSYQKLHAYTPRNFPLRPNAAVQLLKVACINQNLEELFEFDINQKIGISIFYQTFQTRLFHLGIQVFNQEGINIFDAHSVVTDEYTIPHALGRYQSIVWIPANLLSSGWHTVNVAIFNHNEHVIYFLEKDCVSFTVLEVPFDPNRPTAKGFNTNFNGIVRPLLDWEISKIN